MGSLNYSDNCANTLDFINDSRLTNDSKVDKLIAFTNANYKDEGNPHLSKEFQKNFVSIKKLISQKVPYYLEDYPTYNENNELTLIHSFHMYKK